MRASVFVGTSLDGFLARPDGGLDFLSAGGDEPHGYEEFIATIDAMVIGRKTYEIVLGFSPWPYGDKPVFVLSSHPLSRMPEEGTVERLSGDPAAILADLSARGFRHVYVDGGVTIQGFLRAGLVDRLIVTHVPVLVGAGIPLFGTLERDIFLRHVRTRTFPGGLVQSEYRPTEKEPDA